MRILELGTKQTERLALPPVLAEIPLVWRRESVFIKPGAEKVRRLIRKRVVLEQLENVRGAGEHPIGQGEVPARSPAITVESSKPQLPIQSRHVRRDERRAASQGFGGLGCHR